MSNPALGTRESPLAVYSLEQYALMFADRVRMAAYSAAIARAVRPNHAVVDLGCGPGVFALLACKAGARRVYAIDTEGVVDFGRQLAALNGFSDQILFLQGDSRQIHLPERVNVIVSDVRGALPLHSHAIETMEDARTRFLADGGLMVPSQDTLYVAVVELADAYSTLQEVWRSVPVLDLSPGLPLVLNTVGRHHVKPGQLVSEAHPWHVLDYTSGPKIPAERRVELSAVRDATGHGLAIWFQTCLIDSIGFSTEPRASETVYGQIFLPWLRPVPLREGEVCNVNLRAHLVGNDYIWQWETSLAATNAHDEIRFVQSSFYGSLFPPSLLRKRSTGFVPVLNETGQAHRWILHAIDGKRSLQEIASEAAAKFPHVFRRVEDAFDQASEIAEKFSR